MQIAILGFGSQGRSAYEYWSGLGHDVTICDNDELVELPAGAKKRLGKDYISELASFDLIVRSPIVHPNQIVEANDPEILEKVTTNTNEFLKVCLSKNIIGVTGTKGKGTTSTLITEMLKAMGKTVHLGGNIGIPPLDLLKNNIKTDDWVVLELANFQLIDLKHSPAIAVCLMIEPEHLDWHEDIEEYFQAKKQLFIHQKPEDLAIYFAKNEFSSDIASASNGQKIPYYHPPGAYIENDDIVIDGNSICSTDEVLMLGKHNWQNICAAITAVWFSLSKVEGQVDKSVDSIRQVLTTFEGLPFRVELRREVDRIKFYNDSFASAPGATIAAIEAIEEPKILLIGGHERQLPLDELLDAITNNADTIRRVVVYGASAERIVSELKNYKFDNFEILTSKNMDEIVKRAKDLASPGDAVVLSPGFASFDMFKNFEERGRSFNEAVEKL